MLQDSPILNANNRQIFFMFILSEIIVNTKLFLLLVQFILVLQVLIEYGNEAKSISIPLQIMTNHISIDFDL